MRTTNGAFLISRSLYDSGIWNKPPEWLKIWLYLLGNVNFQDNHLFKRGEDLFKYDTIAHSCGVSYKTVENCMKYLRDRNQIGITRTSRGAIISITNYDTYQELSNYKETERKQKGNRKESSSDSIREEGNNGTMKEYNSNDEVYTQAGHLSITHDEFTKLEKEFGMEKAEELVQSVLNYRKNSKYKNLYLTAIKWGRAEKKKENIPKIMVSRSESDIYN